MTVVRAIKSLPYCVYAHYIDGECIYVGVGTVERAFAKGSSRTTLWREAVRGRDYDVEIVERFDDYNEALGFERLLISERKPRCNIQLTGRTRHLRPILHVETGDRYESVRHACDALGLSDTTVNRVLSGRLKRTKGHTFRDLEPRRPWKEPVVGSRTLATLRATGVKI